MQPDEPVGSAGGLRPKRTVEVAMRNKVSVAVVVVIVYFAASIFTNLLPGPAGDLPRMVWSSMLYTGRSLAQLMGMPPEYILILQHMIPHP